MASSHPVVNRAPPPNTNRDVEPPGELSDARTRTGQLQRQTFLTRKAAEQWLAATEVDLRWGDYQGPKQGALTVNDFAPRSCATTRSVWPGHGVQLQAPGKRRIEPEFGSATTEGPEALRSCDHGSPP